MRALTAYRTRFSSGEAKQPPANDKDRNKQNLAGERAAAERGEPSGRFRKGEGKMNVPVLC